MTTIPRCRRIAGGGMIDSSRWTGNEREVIVAALKRERDHQQRRQKGTVSSLAASDAQWRLVVIGQTLQSIDG